MARERKIRKQKFGQVKGGTGLTPRQWTAAGFAAVIVVVGVILAVLVGQPSTESRTNSAPIGGSFELTDHHAKRVTDKDFLGQFMLVYFGYTYCPDVCPTGLQTISDALDLLEAGQVQKITPVMITVDPARDTPEQLRQYVENFHEKLVGLTGSDTEIAAVAKIFRAEYAKFETGEPGDDSYVMDHTPIFYLIGPDGRYVTRYPYAIESEELARRLRKVL